MLLCYAKGTPPFSSREPGLLGVSLKLWFTPPLVAVCAVHSSVRWLLSVPVLRSR